MPSSNRSSKNRSRIWERLSVFSIILFWITLFGGGILIDTQPLRLHLSPGGVAALENVTASDLLKTDEKSEDAKSRKDEIMASQGITKWITTNPNFFKNMIACLVVILFFTPINLAQLCLLSSLLGAYGSRVRLEGDGEDTQSSDSSYPFLSATLRGFFVYLLMISGIFILDTAPFSSVGPGQYMKLAGIMSLFSFILSYNPGIFSKIFSWAAGRLDPKSTSTTTAEHSVEMQVSTVQTTTTSPNGQQKIDEKSVTVIEATDETRVVEKPEVEQP